MNWLTIIVIVLLLVAVVSVYIAIHKHVAYYLPPVSVGKLSREVHNQAALATSLRLELEKELSDFKVLMSDLDQVHQVAMVAHNAMLKAISSKAEAIVDYYENGLFDDIIRDVRTELSSNIAQGLIDRTTRVAGEYVLLQSLDDLELEVSLDARFTSPEDLKEAITRLLKYEFPKRTPPKSDAQYATWLLEVSNDRRKFDNFMGSVGEELLSMQWNGKVALSLATAPVASAPGMKLVPNTPKRGVR
jgi:hypothetical protein